MAANSARIIFGGNSTVIYTVFDFLIIGRRAIYRLISRIIAVSRRKSADYAARTHARTLRRCRYVRIVRAAAYRDPLSGCQLDRAHDRADFRLACNGGSIPFLRRSDRAIFNENVGRMR